MIQLYDRDADAVAAVLKLVIVLRRKDRGTNYSGAAEALRIWDLADIGKADPKIKPVLVDARLESIVAEVKKQRGVKA